MKEYNENSIHTLDARESVRESIGMYIGNSESGGMHHLLEEIVCNAMDEAAAGFGKEVKVVVNSKENKVSVVDQGRGVPFRKNEKGDYAIMVVYNVLHGGGKFEGDSNYKSSIGLNGCGGCVANALSKYMRIVSDRTDGNCVLLFEDGKTAGPQITDRKQTKTGTTVTFIPDPIIFGDCKWDKEAILTTLQMHAILNNNITFSLVWDNNPPIEYCYENGIQEFAKLKIGDKKTITSPIYYKTMVNEGTDTETEVELSIQYVNDGGERVYAFTNGAYNPELGTHVTGFRSAFTSLINNKSREYGALEMKDDNFEGTLVRKGMYLVLSVKMKERPQFNEQAKLKLTSTSARASVSRAVSTLPISKADVLAIAKKALIEKKADEAAQRKRDAEKRIVSGGKTINRLRDMPEKFEPAFNKSGCELFLTEGDSAAGSAKMGRDPQIQAVFPLRGKPLNTFDKELGDIVKNAEIKNILSILGCGIGNNFNINNLQYDKIIIFADADVDGGHINCLLTTLFLVHLPEIIKAGKLYCALPPLYRVSKGKVYHYIYSEKELKKYSGWEINRYKGLGEMDADQLWESSMDPETRHLAQLTTGNIEQTLELFRILMGSKSEDRKAFIQSHAIEYAMSSGDSDDIDEE